MFVCTTVLYKYMKSFKNDVHNLSNLYEVKYDPKQ